MNWINRLIGRKTSRDLAKDRLLDALARDHAKLSPGKMEHLRADLLQVISRYPEIDQDAVHIAQSNTNRQSCITAHIPVVGVASK